MRSVAKHKAICAFCGAGLVWNRPGTIWVTIGSTRTETQQQLYAHADCLAQHLVPDVPFDGSIFEPDESD